jgi:hypothetical protein
VHLAGTSWVRVAGETTRYVPGSTLTIGIRAAGFDVVGRSDD